MARFRISFAVAATLSAALWAYACGDGATTRGSPQRALTLGWPWKRNGLSCAWRVCATLVFGLTLSCGDDGAPTAPTPTNRAPEPTGSIPDRTLQVGETVEFDLTPYFTDPDGDALRYTAESSAAAVVSVSVSGATLTIAGVAKGSATVTVTARDPEGLTAMQTLEVTVPNRVPEAAGPIPDRTLQVGETAELDISPYFTDPDGDALRYTAESSAAAVVSVSVSGATLTIAGVAKGSATVTVTARDPEGLTAMQTLEVTVPNRAPETAGPIPDRTLQVGETAELDLTPYFTDPDGDALRYTAESSAAAVVSVSVSGATLTIAGVAKGSATVTVTARDPEGLTAMQTLEVTVPNRAPETAGPIPDRTLQVGETAELDLSPYFTDPDGDALRYTAESSAAAVVSVSVSGATLTIAGVAKGSATVTVTARDPEGLTAMQTLEVTVPNRAPEAAGPIPDRTLQVGETAELDLSPYFTDPDGDALRYTAESSSASVATATVSGALVTMRGVAVGAATLTVTATDPGGLTATQSLGVTVMPPAPDLVFTTVSPASATLTPGDSVTFTFGIRNRGTVVSGATTIRAMRSSNPIVSARDTQLRTWSFSPLAPSQDRTFPLTISVGAGSAPGTIYIGMCVDPVTDESNTRNNCSEGARLTITGSSLGHQSADRERGIRIRVARSLESRRPTAPL